MNNKSHHVYWDSCVFLSYLNGPDDRKQIIDSYWDELIESKGIIYTSAIAMCEVAYAGYEKEQQAADSEFESKLDYLWDDSSVQIIELHKEIARIARGLIRGSITNGWKLKTNDAIHLATASWLNNSFQPIVEFHTYDEALQKYAQMIGIHICEPQVVQLRLELDDKRILP